MTTTTSVLAVIDALTFASYRFNRDRSPEIAPERWGRIFAGVEALEARYQRERTALRLCPDCGGIVGPWVESEINDPEARACWCPEEATR